MGPNKLQCYLVMDLNKAFLLPDSCTATERNGNCISVDITDANESD